MMQTSEALAYVVELQARTFLDIEPQPLNGVDDTPQDLHHCDAVL